MFEIIGIVVVIGAIVGGVVGQDAQKRVEGAGSGQRCARQEPGFFQDPKFLKDHQALNFVRDTPRMAASGGVEAFDMDQMMERDMEGHTDSKQYAAGGSYGNWELSSDRANAARRLIQGAGNRT